MKSFVLTSLIVCVLIVSAQSRRIWISNDPDFPEIQFRFQEIGDGKWAWIMNGRQRGTFDSILDFELPKRVFLHNFKRSSGNSYQPNIRIELNDKLMTTQNRISQNRPILKILTFINLLFAKQKTSKQRIRQNR